MKGSIAQKFDPRQYMLNKDFEVFHYCDDAPREVYLHHHDFFEIYFFLSRKAEYIIEGKHYKIQSGDILLIKPQELHKPIIDKHITPYERIVLWLSKEFLIKNSDKNTNLMHCFDMQNSKKAKLLRLPTAESLQLKMLINMIIQEITSKKYGGEIVAKSILMQFLVYLNRVYKDMYIVSQYKEKTSTLVDSVINYICENFSKKITLEGLSSMFFVSKYHLSHEFKNALGVSLYRYITLKRLASAKQLIINGIPPTSAYEKSGFSDYSNFYRTFKSEYGISPKAVFNK